MEEEPRRKLDPRIKAVWRISDVIWIVLLFLVVFAVEGVLSLSGEAWVGVAQLVSGIAFVALLALFLFVVTPLRYTRWRFQLQQDFLEIEKGIVWRTHTVVPFIRVQNTDTKQGPILRMFDLAAVTVSTAAGSMEIPGLAQADADAVRDRAAELARIAREDV